MSLINDALRKASQNPAPSGPAETKEPLHVASHQPPPRWPMFVVPPLVALVFAAGTFLVMRGWQSGRPVSAKEAAIANIRQIDAAKEQWEKERAALNAEPATPAKAGTPNAGVAATAPVSTNAPVAEEFPTVKLQGLIWDPKRPSVVINGKSLFVGEKVDRVKVTAIDEESVTLIWNGQQRVLTLR
jgi:hypothetical protein